MVLRVLVFVFFVLPAGAAVSAGATLKGRVVSISDGDTVILLTADNQQSTIRLAGIDAPERGQPWGNHARQALSQLVLKHVVRVEVTDIDSYGRMVGRVFDGKLDVNARMVRNGDAWVYRRYTGDTHLYQLESLARDQGKGLWSLPESARIPPWQWRRSNRPTATDGAASTPVGKGRCGERQVCGQMRSCEEARFYLHQCGLTVLDADGDGEPCEFLCQ